MAKALIIACMSLILVLAGCSKATNAPRTGTVSIKSLDVKKVNHPNLGLAFPGGKSDKFYVLDEAGIGKVRVDVSWALREPTRGGYSWKAMDQRVAKLNGYGIECVFSLRSDNRADWAAPIVNQKHNGLNQVPARMEVWTDFVKALVERYDHDGKDDMPGLTMANRHIMFPNEWPGKQHLGGGWVGSYDQLIEILNATHDAVKEANPQGRFILGGWSSGMLSKLTAGYYYQKDKKKYEVRISNNKGDVTFLDGEKIMRSQPKGGMQTILRVLKESRFDMIDLHLYGPTGFNEQRIDFIQSILPGIPMCALEAGGPNQAYDDDITNDDHFNVAMDLNLHGISRGVEFILWFGLGSPAEYKPGGPTWGNAYVAWFESPSATPRGAYWAYYLLALVLDQADEVTKVAENSYRISRPDGDIFVAWGNQSLTIPRSAQPIQRIDVTNSASGTIAVGAAPEGGETIRTGVLPTIVSEMPLRN